MHFTFIAYFNEETRPAYHKKTDMRYECYICKFQAVPEKKESSFQTFMYPSRFNFDVVTISMKLKTELLETGFHK